jgi:hypothetical protein
MKSKPEWKIPKDLVKIVTEEEMWEDIRWEPIILTVLGGTVYNGREIPLSWQIEFEPSGNMFEEPNKKISALGAEPDGYGWARVIQGVISKYHPEIKDELQFGDTEAATCVIWVESEESCKILAEVAWNLIQGASEA